MKDFVEDCANVTSSSFNDNGTAWVSNYARQLEILEVTTDLPLDFPVYSNTLRELTLSAYSSEKTSIDFWKKVGSTLEKLVLDVPVLADFEIAEIQGTLPKPEKRPFAGSM